MAILFAAYGLLWGLSALLALGLALQVWENRRFMRRRMKPCARGGRWPRVAVFAPCKGRDIELEDNLRSLFRQDYADYEIIFAVESLDDPACSVIRRLADEHADRPSRMVVAGRAAEGGQKVHNLRVATQHMAPDVEMLAFVDSDIRLPADWLRRLVDRARRPEVGATTGYRWFVPLRCTLPNLTLCALNAGIASMMGRHGQNLVWGGSWAIRRETFEELGIREAWRGAVSDDLVASRVLNVRSRVIEAEPHCIVPSPLDMTAAQVAEFVRRQYMMLRRYIPRGWWLALLGSGLVNGGLLASAAFLAAMLLADHASVWLPAVGTAALYALCVVRAHLRQSLPGVIRKEERRESGPHEVSFRDTRAVVRWFDIALAPLIGLANFAGLLSSAFGSRVVWRGVTYRLRTWQLPARLARPTTRRFPLPLDPEPATLAWELPRLPSARLPTAGAPIRSGSRIPLREGSEAEYEVVVSGQTMRAFPEVFRP